MISVEGDFGVRLPKMVVDPPGPESRRMAEILRSHENPGLTNIMDGDIPLAWRRARGTNVQDADGNIYIDFTSGWGAAVAGHAHPKIVEAMKAQLDELVYAPGGYSSNRPRAELSRRLAELTWGRLGKSHLLNSGAEANELALKIARLYKKSSRFVAFEGAYHGMQTAGSLSVTGIKEYKRNLPTALPVVHTPFAYCYRCPVGETYPECDVACLKYTEHMLTDPGSWLDDVAGVIVEPIQGRSGWIVPPKEFMTRLERLCHQNGIPLIYDEVLTGFGRTGRMFCHEHFGASPDIVTCGKGLSSGFPISAVLASGKMMDSVQPGTHLSTYSADPVGCAAALASIQVIQEEGLVERAARLGERFLKAMRELAERYDLVGDARGLGMLVALELVKGRKTKEPAPVETKKLVEKSIRKGLLLQPPGGAYGNVIKMSPPLVMTDEQLDFGIRVLDDGLREVSREG